MKSARARILLEIAGSLAVGGWAAERGVTFGWEAEFVPFPREEEFLVVHRSGGIEARTDRFPFLHYYASTEDTGNREVRSIPVDSLDTALLEMERISAALAASVEGRTPLRSFHLHIRIPKSRLANVPEDQWRGWLSRLGDAAMAWRLENRNPRFALFTTTIGRAPPALLDEQNVIRVREIGDSLDIELRGYMGEWERIGDTARKILEATREPARLQGFPEFQRRSFRPASLPARLEAHLGRGLGAPEAARLRLLAEQAVRYPEHDHLPLQGFEQAPYMTPEERRHARVASDIFLDRLAELLRAPMESDAQKFEAYDRYRHLVQDWARGVKLREILERSLLDATRPPPRRIASVEEPRPVPVPSGDCIATFGAYGVR